MSWIALVLMLLAVNLKDTQAKCGYESCDLGKEGMINVHLIPHTHDDVGWIKTVDQYYVDEVQYILDSVIMALDANPQRKFSYVEVAFFYRWWRQQDDATKAKVQRLVANGQLSFILGGWCMNDEAGTHYNAIIDQHTRGVSFLNKTFGECGRPRVAWQIDPFGHSKEQASLFAQMGYDAVYFARIDYQDYARRNMSRELEMIWKASEDLHTELFTGALYGEHYGPPPGMNFDIYAQHNIQDDERLHDYNVDEVVEQAIKDALQQNESFKGGHITWLMGDDFNYQNAQTWYKNMDKLISLVNARQSSGSKVNLLYSNPSCYTYAKNKLNITWSTKSDDFFPYAHREHAYWSGYFTSRAALKGMVRQTNNFLQVVKQLSFFAHLQSPEDLATLDVLKQAMAVSQHHDAVSGTAKQAVTYDYEERLSDGQRQGMLLVNKAYKQLLHTFLPQQELCPLLNISRCNVTETSKEFEVVVYNPLGRSVEKFISLPVSTQALKLTDSQGNVLPIQFTSISNRTATIPERKGSVATHDLWFTAQLPPLGFSAYLVSPASKVSKTVMQVQTTPKTDIVIATSYMEVIFDRNTHLLKQISNLKTAVKAVISQQLLYYVGMRGNNSKPEFTASGAYLFRPDGTSPKPLSKSISIQVFKGALFHEVRQTFGEWGSQVFRLAMDSSHLEIEWTVGHLPLKGVGMEVISRFTSDLMSQEVFYTDANGRQILQRTKNYRPTWNLQVNEPVASNYYPVNSRIYIQDLKTSAQLTVLTDRTQGGASLNNGSLELMLHRVTMDDDALGVGEPLREKGADGKGLFVRGKHYLLLERISDSARAHRDLGERLFMAPLVTVSRADTTTYTSWRKHHQLRNSFLKQALPDNVHLLTLEPLENKKFLLRLEHFYSAGEDKELSNNVTVSLKDLFTGFTITTVQELTLEANQYLAAASRLRWNKKSFTSKYQPIQGDLNIELTPMAIRTFEVSYS
ncbi:lysosomal alpha-mannosidase-like [Watersipora subatra]|uniref:lysosomal alpha-mannosidase-like n=1 Tax=Watersipora subatra TaxID=2589382 RepID=UPI00355C6E7D